MLQPQPSARARAFCTGSEVCEPLGDSRVAAAYVAPSGSRKQKGHQGQLDRNDPPPPCRPVRQHAEEERRVHDDQEHPGEQASEQPEQDDRKQQAPMDDRVFIQSGTLHVAQTTGRSAIWNRVRYAILAC